SRIHSHNFARSIASLTALSMGLILLVAITGAVCALPRSVRRANYDALPEDVNEPNMDLIFASAIWRHGDRAAEAAVPGREQFDEDAWNFGGGGYGELSPEGMSMHFNLGRRIRKRYMVNRQFLSSAYNAKEIYVRSTDYNRTLISAYSNVAGMYSGFGVQGANFPSPDAVPDWPAGYVPIPVHTVDIKTDLIGHPDSPCARQDQLYELVKQSNEYHTYINDPQVSKVLKYLSEETSKEVTIHNMYDTQNPIFCEGIHIDELSQTGANIEDFYPWFYTGDVPTWVDWIMDKDEDFTNGIANPVGVNGIDVAVEIGKIRSGDTLKMLAGNVHGVLQCRDAPDATACRHFYKKLRYYALSAHDTTVSAFLTILGVKKYIIPEGYPNYSAAVLVEVYEDNGTKQRFFKVLYHADKDSDFKPITTFVRGCDFKSNLCPIAVLDDLVKKYAPETDVVTLCNTPLDVSPPTTTVIPVTGPATTSIPTTTTTTTKTVASTIQQKDTTTSSGTSISIISTIFFIVFVFL
ncbi:hypothetical protein PENTCL1PPCAC_14693, partial [Pristionchus entomophagus]